MITSCVVRAPPTTSSTTSMTALARSSRACSGSESIRAPARAEVARANVTGRPCSRECWTASVPNRTAVVGSPWMAWNAAAPERLKHRLTTSPCSRASSAPISIHRAPAGMSPRAYAITASTGHDQLLGGPIRVPEALDGLVDLGRSVRRPVLVPALDRLLGGQGQAPGVEVVLGGTGEVEHQGGGHAGFDALAAHLVSGGPPLGWRGRRRPRRWRRRRRRAGSRVRPSTDGPPSPAPGRTGRRRPPARRSRSARRGPPA